MLFKITSVNSGADKGRIRRADELGYRTRGGWTDRPGNSSIEESLLVAYSARSGYSTQMNIRRKEYV